MTGDFQKCLISNQEKKSGKEGHVRNDLMVEGWVQKNVEPLGDNLYAIYNWEGCPNIKNLMVFIQPYSEGERGTNNNWLRGRNISSGL